MPGSNPVVGRRLGRYRILDEIASGGMASVHIGQLIGPVGFARTVAIKRMHPHVARDPEFVSMFLDEARLAARIRHPNVVAAIDVVALKGELFLVMDYVQGESLSSLMRQARLCDASVSASVAVGIMSGVLYGLHAAHEATSERGEPLGIVHRDVSPQNVLVGIDGVARVVDFGVAKAARRLQTTADGQVKGKLRYMSPEQTQGQPIDRKTDIYAASVVLWELLTLRPLFRAEEPAAVVRAILAGQADPPSLFRSDIPDALDFAVMRGLSRDPDDRYSSAQEMGMAVQRALAPAPAPHVGNWVVSLAGEVLASRAIRIRDIESSGTTLDVANVSAETAVEPPAKPGLGHEVGPLDAPLGSTTEILPDEVSVATGPGAGHELSVEIPRPTLAASARLRRWAALALGLGLLTVVGFWWRACSRVSLSATATSTTSAGLIQQQAPADSTGGASNGVSHEEGGTTTAAEVSSSDPSAPDASGVAPRTRTKPYIPGPAKPRPNCDPPYVRDANGIRRYKPECLRP
jgi:eukaryotic-like serine/threonine-protein kinase